ncbi:MAG: hypothetical protein M3O07_07110, partial [Pseudomonadota bacterium]|nr:hypothetical protein [Pseudomonadota bacterium]
VLDRTRGKTPAQALHLRFRSLADLSPDKTGASGRVGDSRVHIRRLQASTIEGTARKLRRSSCFLEKYTRGNCDAARFAVSEISAVLTGPDAYALHFIEATPAQQPLSDAIELHATGGAAWSVERGRATWVVAVPSSPDAVSYRVPASTARHVILPFPVAGRDRIRVHATQDAATCRVTIGGNKGAEIAGSPGMFELDTACEMTAVN